MKKRTKDSPPVITVVADPRAGQAQAEITAEYDRQQPQPEVDTTSLALVASQAMNTSRQPVDPMLGGLTPPFAARAAQADLHRYVVDQVAADLVPRNHRR